MSVQGMIPQSAKGSAYGNNCILQSSPDHRLIGKLKTAFSGVWLSGIRFA